MNKDKIKEWFITAEEEIWKNNEKTFKDLYYNIGKEISSLNEKEVKEISTELAKEFEVDEKLFMLAYHFYNSEKCWREAN